MKNKCPSKKLPNKPNKTEKKPYDEILIEIIQKISNSAKRDISTIF